MHCLDSENVCTHWSFLKPHCYWERKAWSWFVCSLLGAISTAGERKENKFILPSFWCSASSFTEGMGSLHVLVFYFYGLQTSEVAHVLFLLSKVRQITHLAVANEDTGHVDSAFRPLDLKWVHALWSGQEMHWDHAHALAYAGSVLCWVALWWSAPQGHHFGISKTFPNVWSWGLVLQLAVFWGPYVVS